MRAAPGLAPTVNVRLKMGSFSVMDIAEISRKKVYS